MSSKEYYKQSFEAMKEACTTLKKIESNELYYDYLLELTRYATLSGFETQAFTYACEAVEHDPLYTVILLEDEDFKGIREALTDELKRRTKANSEACNIIRQKLDDLYVPDDNKINFSDELQKIDKLLESNAFFDSIHALKKMHELEKYSVDNELVSKVEYLKIQQRKRINEEISAGLARKQEKERNRLEEEKKEQKERERQKASEKAERERRAREQKAEAERQRKLIEGKERQEKEARELKERRRRRDEESARKMKILFGVIIISAIIVIVSTILIKNRTRYVMLDRQAFLEQISQPDDKFTYTYFMYNDSEILLAKALLGRKIKVPGNDFEITKYMIKNWTTTNPGSDIGSFDSIIDEVPISKEQKLVHPSEKIRVESMDTFYFANWMYAAHSIRFHGNGAKGVEFVAEAPYGSEYVIPSPKKPVQDNLTFLGWSNSRIGDDEKAFQPGYRLIMPDSDITLYALWEPTDGIFINLFIHTLVAPASIPIAITGSFTDSLIVIRIVLLVLGLVGFILTAVFYGNGHKILGTIFLICSIGTFIWGVVPNLYLAMSAAFLSI